MDETLIHISIDTGDGVPFYLQIMQQIKHLIATGRLETHDELPPVRTLAAQLVINPNTVARAYRELEHAGLVYKRRGAGTYIADGATPYTDDERRRILSERIDGLLVEGRNLGFSLEEIIALERERDEQLRNDESNEEGE